MSIVEEPCEKCEGRGRIEQPGMYKVDCPVCRGTGTTQVAYVDNDYNGPRYVRIINPNEKVD